MEQDPRRLRPMSPALACAFAAMLIATTLAAAEPAQASSSLCAGASPSEWFSPVASVRISHPRFEERGWRMKLRTGPSMDCEANFIWADDNLQVEQLGTLTEPATGTSWSSVRFRHNGYTKQRWVETWSVEGSGGTGGCSGAAPSQRFDPPVDVRISHPRFEERGWQMKLRTGPSLTCEAGHIWAADNLSADQLGTYVEAGTGTHWSYVRFQHNGQTKQRWVETWSVDGAGGSGGCSGASPSERFDPAIPARVSHPQFEERGWRMKLRTGPSMTCEADHLWANDNLPVEQLGTFIESATGTGWSLVRFQRSESTLERWVETWSIEGAGGSGGCSGASPSERFDPSVPARISHPQFEERGWRMKLRTGPSMSCEAGFIWAADNLSVRQMGAYIEAATGTHWSYVRFDHNGQSRTGWVETWSVEGSGGTGGCSGASPSERFDPSVPARVSHPQFEERGWRMKLRTGPSMTCEAGFIWAADNLSVHQLGSSIEAGTGTHWSYVRFDHSGQTKQRWVETWSVEQGGGGGPTPPVDPPPVGVPIVIFDTDMGPDIDDALALAALHEYADQGRAHIAAVTVSRNSNAAADYVDQVNHFYGRPDIPIGVYRNTMGSAGRDTADNYTRTISDRPDWYPFDVNSAALPHGYELMRAVLEASPDNSVVIIQVGFSTNTAELLNRYPDLVRRKARLLSVMAGNVNMPSGVPGNGTEFNVVRHVVSAQIVFDRWPGQLVMSEFQLGSGVLYPDSSVDALTGNHIIKDSYNGAGGKGDMSWHPAEGMRSWDITSVVEAIEPGFIPRELGPGRVTVDGQGNTRFRAGGGNHHVLGEAHHLSAAQKRDLIQKMVDLVSSPPGGGGTDPPVLDVDVTQPSLNCNGVLRVVAVVSGFRDGEDVTVTVGSQDFTRPATGGRRSISWRCYSGGSPIRFGVVGESSGASTAFTINTYGRVTPPQPPPCVTDTSTSLPTGTRVTTTTGAVAYNAPREPFPDCTGSSVGSVGRDTTVDVVRETSGYYKLSSGGWIRKSLTSRPGPCAVGTTLVYEGTWYRAKRTTGLYHQPLETFSATCRNPTGSRITAGAEFIVTAFSGGYARVGSTPPHAWVRSSAIELADPPEVWCPVFDGSYRHPVLGGNFGIVSTKGLGWLAVVTRSTETATSGECDGGATIPSGTVVPVDAMGTNFIVTRYRGVPYFANSDHVEIYTGPRPTDPLGFTPRAWGLCGGREASLGLGAEQASCVFANGSGDVVEVRTSTATFGMQFGVGVNLSVAEGSTSNLSRLGGYSDCDTVGASAFVGVFVSNCRGDGNGADVNLRGISIGVGADFALVGGRSRAFVSYVTDPAEKRSIRSRICAYHGFYTRRVPFCARLVEIV